MPDDVSKYCSLKESVLYKCRRFLKGLWIVRPVLELARNAASKRLCHSAATDRRQVQASQDPGCSARRHVTGGRRDGEMFSPPCPTCPTTFTSLHARALCSLVLKHRRADDQGSVCPGGGLTPLLLLPTFNNVLLLLPSHGQVFAFLLLHLKGT